MMARRGWGLTLNQSADGHQLIIDVIQAFGGSIADASGHKVTFNLSRKG